MNILLVNANRAEREAVAQFLRELGHEVTECDDGAEALVRYQAAEFPLIFTDANMPRMSGLDLLQAIMNLSEGSGTEVVLLTGDADMPAVARALKAGAYDYLVKPVNVEELAAITDRVADNRGLSSGGMTIVASQTAGPVRSAEDNKMPFTVGNGHIGMFSASWRRVLSEAQKYHTDRSISVLIQGETGTGKEIVAQLVHHGPEGSKEPFIDINCAALSTNLFESELFGYEAGAFTGGQAKGQRGKLDLAAGGSVFLDEISEIPLEMQSKLLRALQEKEYYRVGGLKKIHLDARIICATNTNLAERVSQGLFRQDLYYRLGVGVINIPPLRERRESILPLASMFLQEFAEQKGKGFEAIGSCAAELLCAYGWPGNVRELRNMMEWAVFQHEARVLTADHLSILSRGLTDTRTVAPDNRSAESQPAGGVAAGGLTLPPDGLNLQELENKIVYEAYKLHEGNKTRTAQYLGISRSSLYNRLKRLEDLGRNLEL